MTKRVHVYALCLLAARVFTQVPEVYAFSRGITGVSGKSGAICNQPGCHGGGVAPTVQLDGPAEVAPMAIATFRFTIRSNAPQQQLAAGLNVAASGGMLMPLPGQGTQLLAGEITHTGPKRNDSNGEATFEFEWHAPASPGTYTIFAAGNSVNLNGTNQGDRAAAVSLDIRVVDQRETPTPTPTPTFTPMPPSPTATFTPTATATIAEPSPTPRETVCAGDCDSNGEVTVDEIITGVNIALGLAPPDRCTAVDTGGDGEVSVDELVQAVNSALFGCPEI